jgi:hypothetical protein
VYDPPAPVTLSSTVPFPVAEMAKVSTTGQVSVSWELAAMPIVVPVLGAVVVVVVVVVVDVVVVAAGPRR